MIQPFRFPRFAALAAGLLLAGCSTMQPPDEEIREESQLNFVRLPANHPPFFNDSVAFYVRPGRDSEGKIHFQEAGGGRGEAFAEIKIDGDGLLTKPDGSPFRATDSVLIVMKVADQNLLLVELRPSGLRFTTRDPAELKIDYEETEGDLDGDGDNDDDDDDIELLLSIWRQAKLGDPFVKIGTVKTEGLRELKADLTSFSRYAIAY